MFSKLALKMECFWRHSLENQSLKIWLASLDRHLVMASPDLAQKLTAQQIPADLYAIKWLMTCYSQCFPIEVVIKLWDYLLAGNFIERVELVALSLLLLKEK